MSRIQYINNQLSLGIICCAGTSPGFLKGVQGRRGDRELKGFSVKDMKN